MSPPTKGRLLLATPPLIDPHFDRTVIYVLEHHEDGAVGVVLNRASDEALDEPLDRWIDLQAAPSSVFEGGPVEENALIALAVAKDPGSITAAVGDEQDPGDDQDADDEALTRIVGEIASADLSADPAIVGAAVSEVRVFRGYAGWGPGQLDAEIAEGAWIVLDAETADVFSRRPDELWRDVLRRQPGRLAWLANAPDDLSAN